MEDNTEIVLDVCPFCYGDGVIDGSKCLACGGSGSGDEEEKIQK